jgi:hypothetical protein
MEKRTASRRVVAIGPGRSVLPRVVIVVAWSWIAGAAFADGDPIEWRPPSGKASFRKLLADADYRRLSAPVASRLPRALKEAASRLPDHGLTISGVFAPGALEAQGVTLNDVIARVDGEELWGRYGESDDDPIRVRVYSARQDAFRELRVTTDLGAAYSIYRRPELAYLRSKGRNAAWDGDAFLGLVAAPSDPDLAETAWNRALAAGAPRNRLCLASGAQLSLAQGRPETALDFWYEAEHNGGSEPLDPLLGYRVLIANYKLEAARDLAIKYPKLLPDVAEGLEALVASHRARSARDRDAAAPSIQARGMHRRDVRGELIALSPLAENPFLDLLRNRDVFHADAASDFFTLIDLHMPQGLGDFELVVALTIAPTDKRRADFVKLVRLDLGGVRASDGPDRAEAALIGNVELEVPSGFSLRNCEPGDQVTFPDPLVVTDGKARNAIRFLRVGGQMEVFINDRRVLYQPALPELLLRSIRLQAVGTSINVETFTLDELISRL